MGTYVNGKWEEADNWAFFWGSDGESKIRLWKIAAQPNQYTEDHWQYNYIRPIYGTEVKCQLPSNVWLFATPWIIAQQAPLSMEFSSQEYWGYFPQWKWLEGSHFPLQGIFQSQGLNLGLLHCRQILYCLSHQGRPMYLNLVSIKLLI